MATDNFFCRENEGGVPIKLKQRPKTPKDFARVFQRGRMAEDRKEEGEREREKIHSALSLFRFPPPCLPFHSPIRLMILTLSSWQTFFKPDLVSVIVTVLGRWHSE